MAEDTFLDHLTRHRSLLDRLRDTGQGGKMFLTNAISPIIGGWRGLAGTIVGGPEHGAQAMREGVAWGQENVPKAIDMVVGETPGEMALNVALGLPGVGRKAVGLGIASLLGSDEAEGIIPGSRKAMLTLRQQVLDKLRNAPARLEAPGKKAPVHPSLEPEAARETARAAQKEINAGQRLNGPPIEPPDLTGYSMFDYSKLGQAAENTPQFSLVRPDKPAQNKFERLPDWMQDVVSDPYVYRNMEKAIKRGAPYKNWYDIGGYRGALQNEGMTDDEFKRYMLYQTAAAQNVGPKKQVQIGNYLWHADQNGLLVPGAPMSFPKGYGSKAQENIWENALNIKAGGGIDSQKLGSYGESYTGNLNPWTGDTHATRLSSMLSHDPRMLRQNLRQESNPTVRELLDAQGVPFRHHVTPSKNPEKWPDKEFVTWSPRQAVAEGKMGMREAMDRPALWYDTPTGSAYGALEQYLWMPLAEKTGMRTGEGQAAAWVGGGGLTGLQAERKLAQQIFEDSVRDLMMRHGMSAQQAIRAVRKGEKY